VTNVCLIHTEAFGCSSTLSLAVKHRFQSRAGFWDCPHPATRPLHVSVGAVYNLKTNTQKPNRRFKKNKKNEKNKKIKKIGTPGSQSPEAAMTALPLLVLSQYRAQPIARLCCAQSAKQPVSSKARLPLLERALRLRQFGLQRNRPGGGGESRGPDLLIFYVFFIFC
jgi:hypothetical protein